MSDPASVPGASVAPNPKLPAFDPNSGFEVTVVCTACEPIGLAHASGSPVARVTGFLTGRRSKWVVAGAWLLLIVGFAPFGKKLPEVGKMGPPWGKDQKEAAALAYALLSMSYRI